MSTVVASTSGFCGGRKNRTLSLWHPSPSPYCRLNSRIKTSSRCLWKWLNKHCLARILARASTRFFLPFARIVVNFPCCFDWIWSANLNAAENVQTVSESITKNAATRYHNCKQVEFFEQRITVIRDCMSRIVCQGHLRKCILFLKKWRTLNYLKCSSQISEIQILWLSFYYKIKCFDIIICHTIQFVIYKLIIKMKLASLGW